VDESNRRVYYLGSFSTVVAGGLGGFIAWALTTDALFADEGFGFKTIAATILAGIAGTEILLTHIPQVSLTS
jgi:mannitol-specific phosphotransferase system IIBC component